jgi:ABC-type antimicrobial peptide transport system permease subunit
LLAAVGLGSVMSYAVSRRGREIGLRMALGASRRRVVRMVLGEAGRLAAAGLVLGVAGALALGRLLESLLYGVVGVLDLPTLVAVPLVLAAAAVAAAWLPARRASRVSPARALRDE